MDIFSIIIVQHKYSNQCNRPNIKSKSTFHALNLIKPLWYFHLPVKDKFNWPNPDELALLKDLDKKYKSDNSARLELSFLMIMKGWIYNNNNEHQLFSDGIDQKPEIIDEFRFIRKNFNSIFSAI